MHAFKFIKERDDYFESYLEGISRTRLLSHEEEIELSKRLHLYKNGFLRTASRTEYGVRRFYDCFSKLLNKYEEKIKDKDVKKFRKEIYEKLAVRMRTNLITLGKIINNLGGLNEEQRDIRKMRLRNASRLIEEIIDFKKEKKVSITKEEEVFDSIRETYEKASKEIGNYIDKLGEAENKKREREIERLEQRILILERENSKRLGENWEFKNYLMQKRYWKYAKARKGLIKPNLRLVVSVAKNFQDKGLNIYDLIEEGNMGLYKGVEKYDYRLGYKFSTYITWWGKQAMRRALKEKSKIIRIPPYKIEQKNKAGKAREKLSQKLGRVATDEEVAIKSGIKVSDIREFNNIFGKETISLSGMYDPINRDNKGRNFEIIDDKDREKEILIEKSKTKLEELLKNLSERERLVIKLRYGVLEYEGQKHTLEEAGWRIGLTRERTRQIEARALTKLKEIVRSINLEEFLVS